MASLAGIAGCGGGGGDTIQRVSRQNNSGTYAYFREVVLGEDREFKLGSNDKSGSKDVVELVAKTPNAIGYSGMGYATDEVKMLPVSVDRAEPPSPRPPRTRRVAPTRWHENLYIYIVGEPTGALKHYLEWIRSSEGQAIVGEIGYVPVDGDRDDGYDSSARRHDQGRRFRYDGQSGTGLGRGVHETLPERRRPGFRRWIGRRDQGPD